ncbi:hypothetical protein M1446_01205 [Candidatus Dependentiae bacterium]|nr:hypothetical protein [Candidatus Dependentiae bacterium]
MKILKKLLYLFLLFQFYIANSVLFINDTGFSFLILQYYGQEVIKFKKCAEVKDEILKNKHLIIQLATKKGPYLFYNDISFDDKITPNTIVVFKDSSYKIYYGNKLGIAINCENKDLILEKIEELEKLNQIKIEIPEENKPSRCSELTCNLV